MDSILSMGLIFLLFKIDGFFIGYCDDRSSSRFFIIVLLARWTRYMRMRAFSWARLMCWTCFFGRMGGFGCWVGLLSWTSGSSSWMGLFCGASGFSSWMGLLGWMGGFSCWMGGLSGPTGMAMAWIKFWRLCCGCLCRSYAVIFR